VEEKLFLEKSEEPKEPRIKEALGNSYKYLEELISFTEYNIGAVVKEWKYYGKSGWSMKLLLKKRNLLFFSPYKGFFRIGMVFGDKAVKEIETSDLPADIINEITSARKYAEGRGIRIDVKDKKDLDTVKKLLVIKSK